MNQRLKLVAVGLVTLSQAILNTNATAFEGGNEKQKLNGVKVEVQEADLERYHNNFDEADPDAVAPVVDNIRKSVVKSLERQNVPIKLSDAFTSVKSGREQVLLFFTTKNRGKDETLKVLSVKLVLKIDDRNRASLKSTELKMIELNSADITRYIEVNKQLIAFQKNPPKDPVDRINTRIDLYQAARELMDRAIPEAGRNIILNRVPVIDSRLLTAHAYTNDTPTVHTHTLHLATYFHGEGYHVEFSIEEKKK